MTGDLQDVERTETKESGLAVPRETIQGAMKSCCHLAQIAGRGPMKKKKTLSDLFLVTTFNPLSLSQTVSCQMLFNVIKLEIVK